MTVLEREAERLGTPADGGDIVVSAEQVTKCFRRKAAVRDVSFKIQKGRICGFVGPNGAGKTTTLRMLMGLLKPTAGKVRILDMDPLREPMALRERVGYVPENHYFFQWMRVRQLLTFVARVYRQWDPAACASLVDRFSLPTDRMVRDLSRGETAKLALTIALSHRPDLLILDEPTVGLDPLIRREFTDALLEGMAQRGKTVFFSTHILSDLENIADDLVLIGGGQVLAAGSTELLRRRFLKASYLFTEPPDAGRAVPGALQVTRGIREWVAVFPAGERVCETAAAALGAKDFVMHPVTLEEVFVLLMNGRKEPPCGQ